jgi:hypothetical protein
MSNEHARSERAGQVRVGLVVAFAALGNTEEQAIQLAWECATTRAAHWLSAFVAFGLEPVTAQAQGADILVYLGESSRFDNVAGQASGHTPILFVKSTVEELLARPLGAAPRYRMCTGVHGIARALASVAPLAPTVDWQTVPWPASDRALTHLDEAEMSYVETSVGAFRTAAEKRGIPWRRGLPEGDGPFSVFLTMHDPAAAQLAETALGRWPQATVLAADGMVATRAPSGGSWPERLVRVRHWSPRSRSASNRLFRDALATRPMPDFDSAGMLFGTMCYLDGVFGKGEGASTLEAAGAHTGPLGPMRMTAFGRPEPERIMLFRGERSSTVTIE